jgi:hypothetical protein
LKVSEKGGLSLYGMGRFPVALYKEQWLRILASAPEIEAFIRENDSKLKTKESVTLRLTDPITKNRFSCRVTAALTLQQEAVYIAADRCCHLSILLAIRRRTIHLPLITTDPLKVC